MPPKPRSKESSSAKAPTKTLSFQDCIEEAIDLEDRGDRYKDGDKARRFYESASECYRKAASLKEDADCLYNWGRLLLLLAEFEKPPYSEAQRSKLLKESLIHLTRAAELDAQNADTWFNLSQARQAFFELESQALGVPTDKDLALLSESASALEKALALQRTELESSKTEEEDKHDHDHDHENDVKGDKVEQGSEEEIAEEDDGDEDYELVTERKPVTPETISETLVAMASLLTLTGSTYYSIGRALEADTALQRALALLDETHDLTKIKEESADVSLARAAVHAAYGEAYAEAQAGAGAGCERKWLASFDKAATILEEFLGRQPNCAEASADLGDVFCSLADAYMTVCIGSSGLPGFDVLNSNVEVDTNATAGSSGSSGSSGVTEVDNFPSTRNKLRSTLRTIYSKAAKAFSTAHGIEPTKMSILLRLGDLETNRTFLYNRNDTEEKKTADVLFSNAVTYYTKVLQLNGLSFALPAKRTGLVDVNMARSALLGIAKVLSHLVGREKECQVALSMWRSMDGDLEDSDAMIPFSDLVLQTEWFEKLVS
ncbi:hypothetical protein HDU76_001489 [Blyttiomyces sp. JEL0837]|nr:hypothetical protein HDU76_001489 [Blyttiomyces sp. JEL0837]